mmetsp:Transcript_5673/g.35283  ORF Transcript_5673/g.35283 Transcript_5673/m.35283 type:complete len:87 (+) Transcript_5673:33-293(+)
MAKMEANVDDDVTALAEAEEQEEKQALGRIVRAFMQYEEYLVFQVERWERNFERMSTKHQVRLQASFSLQRRSDWQRCLAMLREDA